MTPVVNVENCDQREETSAKRSRCETYCSTRIIILAIMITSIIVIVFGAILHLIIHQGELVEPSLLIGYGLAFVVALLCLGVLCGYNCGKRNTQHIIPI